MDIWTKVRQVVLETTETYWNQFLEPVDFNVVLAINSESHFYELINFLDEQLKAMNTASKPVVVDPNVEGK